MKLYVPMYRGDPDRRETEIRKREAAGGQTFAHGHLFEVGAVVSVHEAHDRVQRKWAEAPWPIPGAALLDDRCDIVKYVEMLEDNRPTPDESAYNHFLDLARPRGVSASSGEQAARQVAEAIVKHVPLLDDKAIDGLMSFLRIAKAAPSTATKLIG